MKIINSNIEEGRFKRNYLLCGDEDYLINQYKNKLIDAISEGNDMNYSYYEGKDISIKEVLDTCETLPFFAERRLVIIENAGLFKGGIDDSFIEYVKNAPDYLTIVFIESEPNKTTKLYKAISGNGYVCELNKQNEATLKSWIARLLKSENKYMDSRTMQTFIEYAGDSMNNIKGELEKLFCYTLGRDTITEEDIRQVCVETVESRMFEMIAAVANKKQKQALNLYYDMLSAKEPPMVILYNLARQFNLLLQVKELLELGYSKATIAKKTKRQEFVIGKCEAQCRMFTKKQLREAVNECTLLEEATKTGKMDDKLCVELIIVKYSGGKQ